MRGGRRGVGRLAQVAARGAYRRVVLAEHGGPGGGDAAVVAAGLVPVAQLLGDPRELVAEGQHQRVAGIPAPLRGGVRLLEHPPGGEWVVGLPVQPSQQVRGVEHLRVISPVRRVDGFDGLGQQLTGGGQITRGTQGERRVLNGGQWGGMGHMVMLPVDRPRTLPGPAAAAAGRRLTRVKIASSDPGGRRCA